ncbi:unnamed protein product [Diamesa hyperborea]
MSSLNKYTVAANNSTLKINSPTSDFDLFEGSDDEKAVQREITSDLEVSDVEEAVKKTTVDITGITMSLDELLAIVASATKPAENPKVNKEVPPTYITTVEEMNRLRISRHTLETCINLPIFDELVVGCFVKVGNKIAEILEVVETSLIYTFGDNVLTNKKLFLSIGADERTEKMAFVSNQAFTIGEFKEYQHICKVNAVRLPNINEIALKKERIKKALVLLKANTYEKYQTLYVPKPITSFKRSPEPMELPQGKRVKLSQNRPEPKKKTSISLDAYKQGRRYQ